MAITDIARYTHLSAADIKSLGSELDTIRSDIENSRGAADATYIRRTILFQRTLDVVARLLVVGTRSKIGWTLGTAALGFAKSVENMEIGHNVSHGQWDWMNDPEIHSSTWEWDMVAVSSQWRSAHNYRHHVFSNVLGEDDDLGFGVMRVTRDQPWEKKHLLQPLQNLFLALTFEWGIALHDVDLERTNAGRGQQVKALLGKIARQGFKDYALWPALSIKRWRRTMGANAVANLLRNLWAYVVIFCGHFPAGTQKFTTDVLQTETRAEWYLRQMLGAANFKAGRLLGFASGNLCYQIEHHLFPDLPSNRLAEIAARVRPLCEKYGLPYNSESLAHQYGSTLRIIHRLALPDNFFGTGRDADVAAISPRGRKRRQQRVASRRGSALRAA
ncbi:fatty acid desaturase family protein [Mycolicibacterium pyrenivorans]|uniref:fatty acid desaturase family protein n=1 Tax=Mycolicibacterium pyrenivorans TaxID=187102 RepID=UPI0021F2E837|nr:acyl-CoA desaturase [Mycolicibacterium pyrenivorans]MCV7155049.1 acyl-CoA desaturase [Mycolicibacterium pyrenivorans]